MNRAALFGGTFDPIHRGHINLATEAVRECDLNQLIFLPNYISPFKRDSNVTPGEMRAEMIRRILPLNSAFSISEYELERQEPSYSYDTLRYFRERMPDAEISCSEEISQSVSRIKSKPLRCFLYGNPRICAERKGHFGTGGSGSGRVYKKQWNLSRWN